MAAYQVLGQTGPGSSPIWDRICEGNAGDFTGRTAVTLRVAYSPHLIPIIGRELSKRPVDGSRRHLGSPPIPTRPRRPASGGGKVEGNPGRRLTWIPHSCGGQRRGESVRGQRPDGHANAYGKPIPSRPTWWRVMGDRQPRCTHAASRASASLSRSGPPRTPTTRRCSTPTGSPRSGSPSGPAPLDPLTAFESIIDDRVAAIEHEREDAIR
jgi:hypothetical protein